MSKIDTLAAARANFLNQTATVQELILLEKYSSKIGPGVVDLKLDKLVAEFDLPEKIIKTRLGIDTLPASHTRLSVVAEVWGGIVHAARRPHKSGRGVSTALSGRGDE